MMFSPIKCFYWTPWRSIRHHVVSRQFREISISRNFGYLELVRQHNGGWLKCICAAEHGRLNSSIAVLKMSRLNHFEGQFVSHDGKEAVLLDESWDELGPKKDATACKRWRWRRGCCGSSSFIQTRPRFVIKADQRAKQRPSSALDWRYWEAAVMWELFSQWQVLLG